MQKLYKAANLAKPNALVLGWEADGHTVLNFHSVREAKSCGAVFIFNNLTKKLYQAVGEILQLVPAFEIIETGDRLD